MRVKLFSLYIRVSACPCYISRSSISSGNYTNDINNIFFADQLLCLVYRFSARGSRPTFGLITIWIGR